MTKPPQQSNREKSSVKTLFKSKKKPFKNYKLSKQILKEKRARLVVKNLPFKASEEDIKKHFEQYGHVSSIDLLKKPDGKLKGCAFIQFTMVQFAKKAHHYTNNQPFMGRNISVNFARPKDEFVKENKKMAIKTEEDDKLVEVKQEEVEIKDEDLDYARKEDLEDNEESVCSVSESHTSRFKSHDVAEGRTVFIKNVPFHATNDDIKQCMSQFGPTYYALICQDKLTEHSKGTGFVKFVNKEDAEKALSAGTELTLLGNILDCHPAVDRNELRTKEKEQKEMKSKPKDSRNLYLVKEGVILANSKAAEGVSVTDMAKRLQIEQYKTQMLRNLNTFVSKERLVVHNLPASWDDAKLKTLLMKHGGKGAVIKEARVMRDLNQLDSNGIGQSKRFGFVAFNKHEHALSALRSLNNNPNVFSKGQRPIVCFSIESKTALKAKIKRQEKSRIKNPKAKDYVPKLVAQKHTPAVDNGDIADYAGIAAKEGTVQKMRGRYKLNQQAKLHYENVKKEKRKKKMSKKSLKEKKKDFTKQPKQKINKSRQEDDFSKMVSGYKKKLGEAFENSKKSKWYQE
ncbi:RNA-binding protein 28 [Euwallacea fornicatus]|uniref:RNA-binding protein 28 n=1 Tax=Euwallacea fornicatus TaxID=995702 RepID=UPI00338EE589